MLEITSNVQQHSNDHRFLDVPQYQQVHTVYAKALHPELPQYGPLVSKLLMKVLKVLNTRKVLPVSSFFHRLFASGR